ncbi:methylamine utilization protein MauE [Kribbella antibiotica]|uniref:Methylamine utilization protein MauE n=1 Tax=Kribbella antibiotica TaxID=190195 RepID=A0A4R4ZQV6_9ACTN|nr:MauE/DoxX family redox-associated membrane protein [Kribbella antibiotica]TDD60289.1 methylamine utilization protein MauE [Kribbella antibiotica]
MVYLLLSCCLCLAFVFGQSAVSKTGSKAFRDFAGSAGPLEILPTGLRVPAAAGVVVAEVTLTVALLVGAFSASLRFVASAGFLLAVLLLLSFTAAIVVTLRRGIRKPCKCFGAATTPLGRAHVVRNVLLLAAAVAGLVAGATRPESVEPAGFAIAAVAGLVGGLLVTRFDDLVELFGSQAIG